MRRAVVVLWASVFVLAAGVPAHAQEVRTSVSGTVFDSVSKQPLDSAVVQMVRADRPGDGRTVISSQGGKFRFDSIGAGNWLLGFMHPALDSLGIPSPLLHVRVEEPEPIRAMLAIPSAATIVKSVCGFPVDSGGLWYGYTRSAVTGQVIPGATVQAQWSRFRVVGTSIQRDLPVLSGQSDENGSFRNCSMPTEEIVLAKAWHEADSSGVVTFTMPASGLLRRDIYVAPIVLGETRVPIDSGSTDSTNVPVRVGNGRLVGRVTRPNGQAVRGARVRFMETGTEAVSNDEGYFGLDSLPLGSSFVDARAIGSISAVRPVDIVADQPATVNLVLDRREVYLDTVKVTGRRVADSQQHIEFLNRKKAGFGRFWDEDDIEKRNAFYISDLIRMTPGVQVLSGNRIFFRPLSGFSSLCTPNIFLDGMRLGGMEDIGVDALVNIQDVRAIEVYTRTAQIPPQFQTLTDCGSIVVWTGARSRRLLR